MFDFKFNETTVIFPPKLLGHFQQSRHLLRRSAGGGGGDGGSGSPWSCKAELSESTGKEASLIDSMQKRANTAGLSQLSLQTSASKAGPCLAAGTWVWARSSPFLS